MRKRGIALVGIKRFSYSWLRPSDPATLGMVYPITIRVRDR